MAAGSTATEGVRERTQRILDRARSMGLGPVGVARAEPTEQGHFYREWLDLGMHGTMAYLARPDAVERRADPRRSLAGARSVLVAAHHYGQGDPPGIPEDPSRGVIARYARGRDYHKVLGGKLRALARFITGTEAPGSTARAWVDTGPMLERELAQRAGLGWFGKNTMLIDPERGSWFFLGCVITDLELEPSGPFTEDRCGTCSRCLDACPTGALLGRDENGAPIMDARRCISYLTIEHRGAIPLELRSSMGNRIYGCDICQEVCPWNERFAVETAEPGYAARGPGQRPAGVEAVGGVDPDAGGRDGVPPRPEVDARPGATPWHPGTGAPALLDLLRMSREDWEAFSRGSAIRRAGYAGFRRNVAVAIGNWLADLDEPPREAVRALRDALDDEDPLVREHAAWALGRVG